MTIRNLPQPTATSLHHHVNKQDDDDVSGDATYPPPPMRPHPSIVASSSSSSLPAATQLCAHAVSLDHVVFGIRTTMNEQHDDNDDKMEHQWWTWQRSLVDTEEEDDDDSNLAGHRRTTIHALRSNPSGTVIAVASDGVVSLLRGCDGHILATRTVTTAAAAASNSGSRRSSASSTNPLTAIRLAWIPGQSCDEDDTDVLLIEVPMAEEDSNAASHDNINNNNNNNNNNSQLILVANIHGEKLNDTDPAVVTDAVRSTRILPIRTEATAPYDIRAYFATRSNVEVRLVACDAESRLVIFDVDRRTHELHLQQQDGLSLQLHSSSTVDAKQDYTIDFELGLFPQIIPNATLMLCSAFVDPTAPMIVWFHPVDQQTVCVYTIPSPNTPLPAKNPINSKLRTRVAVPTVSTTSTATTATTMSKVIAMEAISSWNNSEAMATAIAVKTTQKSGIAAATLSSSSSVTYIYVVQTSLDDAFGLTTFGRPHLVYSIPMNESVVSLQLAPFGYGDDNLPYSFRYQLSTDATTGADGIMYKAFLPDRTVGSSIGKLRACIHQYDFSAADRIVQKIGSMSLTMESYADFHPSEIVRHQLQHAFLSFDISNHAEEGNAAGVALIMDEIQLCLRELVHGAILNSGPAGGTLGLDIFVQSVDFLMEHASTTTNCHMNLVTFHQCRLQVASAIQSVLTTVVDRHTPAEEKLERHRHAILEQVMVLDYLSSSSSRSLHQDLLVPFHGIRSLPHLYEICIQERHFATAENVFQSNRKASCWTTTALVKPLLQYITGANVAPKEYIFLLPDVIFANLVINDGMLSRLKTWSCRIADALDDCNEDDRDLKAAILLLKTMDAGIRKLQLRIHGSFASYSPFTSKCIDTRHTTYRRPSSKTNSSLEQQSADRSLLSFGGTQIPLKNKKNNEGFISMRDEPIPTILERGALQRGPTNSSSAKTQSHDSCHDDAVQLKLQHAQCIKHARDLGLGREVVSLQDFFTYGGSKRVARDLVRLLSSSADTHVNRKNLLDQECLPFCRRYLVEYDDVLYDCVVDVCRNKNVDITSMEECCSIARCCSSAHIRCQITLTILQAALHSGRTCGPLFELSKEAINDWAPKDTNVQSELQEALRLLQIDDIILRYCGSYARELFRVSNPNHARNLLNFVTQQIEHETVVDDVISLCGAFNNLCAFQASTTILENSILHDDSTLCLFLFDKLLKKDADCAERALASAISYADVILTDCSCSIRKDFPNARGHVYKERASRVCAQLVALLRFAVQRSLNLSSSKCPILLYTSADISFHYLLTIFSKIQRLQKEYSVYVSISEMFLPKEITSSILPFLAILSHSCDSSTIQNRLNVARTVCSLLTMLPKDEERDIWVTAVTLAAIKMVRDGHGYFVLQFLRDSGAVSNLSNRLRALCHVTVTGLLCETTTQNSSSAIEVIHPLLFASALLTNWSVSSVTANDLMVIVEVAGHLDVACQVLSRCDEGVGELVDHIRNTLRHEASKEIVSSLYGKPNNCKRTYLKTDIHPSWYVGDGILLPPTESLKHVTLFLNGHVRKDNIMHDGTIELYELLVACGAHSLALKILCESASMIGSILHQQQIDGPVASIRDSFDDTIHALLERSLGGSGTGITSCLIDSQQAVTFLLHHSPRHAFLAYKSCLPNSMKMQNFERLQILSNVGMIASAGDLTILDSSIAAIGWKNQHKFFVQCQQLARKAKWWNILQYFGVEFDSHLFLGHNEKSDVDASTNYAGKYAMSLLPSIISKISETLDSSQVLNLVLYYSEIFKLPRYQATNSILEHTFLRADSSFEKSDKVCRVEITLRISLEWLTPPLRCQCLRRCLMNVENAVSLQGEYERINLILCLYHDSLTFLMENDHTMQGALLETEMEYVERRRDVLAILTAIFPSDTIVSRPTFSSFFLPLPEALGHTPVTRNCGILGKSSPSSMDDFDPLEPLEQLFAATHELGIVTALAPLCSPLLLPNGYVHARSLMTRFKQAQKGEIEYPSFNNDMLTVLNKLASPSDRAALAGWCTKQCNKHDGVMLNCLTELLNATISASTEIEHRRRHFPNDKMLKQQERDFLEKIRTISSAHSTLSIFLKTTNMLRDQMASAPSVLCHLVECLIAELEKTVRDGSAIAPEAFVDFLLETGSRLSSDFCLNDESSYTIDCVRQCCTIIRSACSDIATQYSHVDIDDRARQLAHRWLFFGDDISIHPTSSAAYQTSLRNFDTVGDETTMTFVMDLSALDGPKSDGYSHTVNAYTEGHDESRTDTIEERSSLHFCTSRELSEAACQRSALRIAFVLACSLSKQIQKTDAVVLKENTNINERVESVNSKHKRVGLLAQVQTKRVSQDDNNVLDLGLELLRIVFAKSGSFSSFLQRFLKNSLVHNTDGTSTEIPSTVTFAMRHRTLRVAAILCPQDILEEIVRNEGMLSQSNNLEQLSLRQCSYGAFLAKEIEEIGLPLPHSELLQLSSMQFLSYARSLWRDHRDDAILSKSKGRFNLLLIELSLHSDCTDPTFVGQVLDEMVRRNQPRSLLKSLEHVVEYESRVIGSPLSVANDSVKGAISSVFHSVLSDLARMIANRLEILNPRRTEAIDTVERLNAIIISKLEVDAAISHFDTLIDILKPASDEPTMEVLLAMTAQFRQRAERYSGRTL